MSNELRVMSNEEKKKIVAFTDLNAWKEAHKLALLVYKLTDSFPNKEQYSLTSQMRRAGVSITSNIAEGFSRFTASDRVHFYVMAQGSLTELQSQTIIARDLGYIELVKYEESANLSLVVHKLLTGLIKATRIRK